MKIYLLTILVCLSQAMAQYPKYQGCDDLTDGDFKEVKIFGKAENPSLDQPMRMDFRQDASGAINIYFVERRGKIKYFDATSKVISEVGKLDVFFKNESGLLGIALDPKFKENGLVYFYWSPKTPMTYRLSRFKINLTTNKLDMASEKVLIDIPDTRLGLIVHTGGSLFFDKEGNLWVTIGEHDHKSHVPKDYHSTTNKESSNEDASTDTYSLYGSILKIRPDNSARGYSIPEGNFGTYWSSKFASENRNVLAKKYAIDTLVKDELYAKGFRNPMSITVDPLTGWAAVSECGGQCHKINPAYYCPTDKLSEKHMVITEPSFHGWSYFHGNNHPYVMNKSLEKNPLAPVNNSPFRKGIDTLPPAVPGTYVYGLPPKNEQLGRNWICAVGSYIYRYDKKSTSPSALPPHFDGTLFISDLNQSFIRGITLDSTGKSVKASKNLFASILSQKQTMDLRQGPDGTMYFLNYAKAKQNGSDAATGVYKLEYTGSCKPTSIVSKSPAKIQQIFNGREIINIEGSYTVDFFGVNGQKVLTHRGNGQEALPLEKLQSGVYKVRVTSEKFTYDFLLPSM